MLAHMSMRRILPTIQMFMYHQQENITTLGNILEIKWEQQTLDMDAPLPKVLSKVRLSTRQLT